MVFIGCIMKTDSVLKTKNNYSFSKINTFQTCPQKYKINYIDKVRIPDEGIEAFMGKRVHEVLEWLYNKDNQEKPHITFDLLCQNYDNQWLKHWHNNIIYPLYALLNTKNNNQPA